MGSVVVVASFRASNIFFMSACAFILSSDGRVGPAFKLNREGEKFGQRLDNIRPLKCTFVVFYLFVYLLILLVS